MKTIRDKVIKRGRWRAILFNFNPFYARHDFSIRYYDSLVYHRWSEALHGVILSDGCCTWTTMSLHTCDIQDIQEIHDIMAAVVNIGLTTGTGHMQNERKYKGLNGCVKRPIYITRTIDLL